MFAPTIPNNNDLPRTVFENDDGIVCEIMLEGEFFMSPFLVLQHLCQSLFFSEIILFVAILGGFVLVFDFMCGIK